MNGTRISGNELQRMLEEAVESLHGRSSVLERATRMSKAELGREIDDRIYLVSTGTLNGVRLEQVKAEARTLALLRLRRG